MKALSIRQPYAWLIVNGHKDVENRTWHTPYRGPVLIHAGKTYPKRDHADDFETWGERGYPADRESMLGGIVGIATITGCVTSSASRWWIGPVGFTLADVLPLPALIPCKGELGFFDVPAEVAMQLPQHIRERMLGGAPPQESPWQVKVQCSRGERTLRAGLRWCDSLHRGTWEIVEPVGGRIYSPSGFGGTPTFWCRPVGDVPPGAVAWLDHARDDGCISFCGDSIAAGLVDAAGVPASHTGECQSSFPGFCDWPECACPRGVTAVPAQSHEELRDWERIAVERAADYGAALFVGPGGDESARRVRESEARLREHLRQRPSCVSEPQPSRKEP